MGTSSHKNVRKYAALAVIASLLLAASCGGSSKGRSVNDTEVVLGPISASANQGGPEQIIELNAYAQIGENRGTSLSFPERPVIWQVTAGTLGTNRSQLEQSPSGFWTDQDELAAKIGDKIYWRLPQQRGHYTATVRMADFANFKTVQVLETAERLTIDTGIDFYALEQIELPPTSVKAGETVQLFALTEATNYGLEMGIGNEGWRRVWRCNAGKLAEKQIDFGNISPGASLLKPDELSTKESGAIWYKAPGEAGIYSITVEFHGMLQEALIFVVER